MTNDTLGAAAPLQADHANLKGPRDDFFCWKFLIWYPSEDCVFRHTRRTYQGCAWCFQGRLNLRHIRKGLKVPVVVALPGRTSG